MQPALQLGPPGSGPPEGGSAAEALGSPQPAPSDSGGSQQRCSYAAVFDGHSAADAADMAAKRLHVLLTGELRALDRCRHDFTKCCAAPCSACDCHSDPAACVAAAHGTPMRCTLSSRTEL